MKRKTINSELLSQDPEALQTYFDWVAKDNDAYRKRIKKTKSVWQDWCRQNSTRAR